MALIGELLIQHPDVFGARALRTFTETEFDVITLVDPGAIQRGLMKEDISTAVVLLDEPEALEVIEAINDASSERQGRRIDSGLEAATSAIRSCGWGVGIGLENGN